jgi:DNA repair protein RadA/Sms
MASKAAVQHVCRECGFRTAKWFGKCGGCGAFGSVEESVPVTSLRSVQPVVPISEVPLDTSRRDKTGIGELDRALGGGFVPGGVVLLAGDPGIGKSTLLLEALFRLSSGSKPVLYVSGEESLQQIRLRGERLGTLSDKLLLAAETDAEVALDHARRLKPRLLAIDSVQTLAMRSVESAAGSVTQVREVGHRLAQFAKETGTPVVIVGHVTKEGSIAGPRVLEHMVDTVLFFEGDRSHAYRVLRAHKNRFGSTNEIGVFEMKGEGLVEVSNPSALFLAERPRGSSGSAVTAVMTGSRPLLVEVQALVADSSAGGAARRTALGVDSARVALLTAVLERKEGIVICDKDIYVSVAGGASLPEPAGDLAVGVALMSSLRDRPIDPRTLVLGEVGLAGEVRAVGQIEQRLAEAVQLGFNRCILPEGNQKRTRAAGLELCGVSTMGEAMTALFD